MTHSPELSTAHWRSSSYSNSNGGECVEISDDFPGVVPVRDSKNPAGPALVVQAAAWGAFVSSLK
ncbi:DUF397 domain-containing protein [Streptomyces sp. NPDC056178]|uniref:DUF397 domain-containing protein n=1 Tax=unclassified Streptomyces TaxID=2593676 RepID=UPI0035DB3E59|nr:DUF397 domain-containing protein [Streptomyces sp. NBC_00984]